MAVAYLRYSNRYENEMVEAMTAQVGIWGGPFIEPEQMLSVRPYLSSPSFVH
jgi:hypothetical protein